MYNRSFYLYKHFIMPHGKHVFPTPSDIVMEIICAYPSSNYALPHWKCVFLCCVQCTHIYLPSPESDQPNSNISPTI